MADSIVTPDVSSDVSSDLSLTNSKSLRSVRRASAPPGTSLPPSGGPIAVLTPSESSVNIKNASRSSAHSVVSDPSLESPTTCSDNKSYLSEHRRGGKRTTFDKVFVYEFALTIGNNPAVREGCPIALGRKCVHNTVVDMELYEKSRRSGARNRRKAKDLYIPVFERASMLISRGFTLENIVETVLEVEKIKKSRQECMKLNGWQKFNCAIDSAGRSLFRKFTSGNNNKNKWNAEKNNISNSNSDSNDIKGGQDQKRGNVVRAARTA
eukprot:CAMPEP_0172371800 /NCGR_PEP_ID=MMETSP1060-20121228/44919_1 /TAXON_ID=37318 /ORGANISM="Pseudo-nitzschia pungens, Strain cf. cingulata" /LENGTH=266 /DNA_ID=CAMNT_0013097549 /DNA_START=26 /DNA_END=826 /DNA_ORIENTATION=+